jgi:hypothetical protein
LSVRVCLLRRASRGVRLASARLVGAASDERWVATQPSSSDPQVLAQDLAGQPGACAAWLAKGLQGPRSTDTLELLLLDDEGSACTWLTTSTSSDDVVGELSRAGSIVETSDENSRPAETPAAFFAPSAAESTVQVLASDEAFAARTSEEERASEAKGDGRDGRDGRSGGRKGFWGGLLSSLQRGGKGKGGTREGKAPQGSPRRVAVLATHDALARVMLDALDGQGVQVGAVATLWHALCVAWDPRTTRALAAPIIAQQEDPLVQRAGAGAQDVVGVVCVLSEGRLVWAWSRQGELVAGSSQVLRMRAVREDEVVPLEDDSRSLRQDAAQGVGQVVAAGAAQSVAQRGGAKAQLPMVTGDDIARLMTDWLAWSAQLSVAPSQVVCILPDELATGPQALSAGEATELIAQRWGLGGTADVDATLAPDPLGATLERCAKVLASTPRQAVAQRTHALAGLSQRPGRASRRLHAWGAAGIGLLGVGLGVLGLRLLDAARDADRATLAWRTSWQGKVKEVYPPASTPPPTITPLMLIEDEIKRREATSTRPAGVDAARPVVRELELLSLVLASPTVEVLSISLDSASVPVVEVLVPTTSEGEAVLEGLRRVGGSTIASWSMEIFPSGEKRRLRLSGRWQERPAPAGRGGA